MVTTEMESRVWNCFEETWDLTRYAKETICRRPKTPNHHLISFGTRPRESELTKGGHMLAGSDGLETNKGNLHTGKCANGIPRRVRDVKPAGESTHEK